MDTTYFEILKYSLNHNRVSSLCNFSFKDICVSCFGVLKSYFDFYKKMVLQKVSTWMLQQNNFVYK